MHVQSCCFANLNLVLFCRSRCRPRRRCLSSLLAPMGSLPHQTENFCLSNLIEAKLKLCARASKLPRITQCLLTYLYVLFVWVFLGIRRYIRNAPKGLKQRSLRVMFDDGCSRPEGMLSMSFSHEQRND